MKKLNIQTKFVKGKRFAICKFIIIFCFLFFSLNMNAQNRLLYEKHLTENNVVSVDFYDKEIIKNPNFICLKLLKTYNLVRSDKLEQAKEEFEKIEVGDTNNSDEDLYYMINGLLYLSEGDRSNAFKNFELSLLKEQNKNKWTRLELYFFYLGFEDYKAFGFLDEALTIDPYFNEAIIEKALFLDTEYNCNEIIELLKKVPSSYKDASALNHLGVAYYNCHKIDKSVDTLKESIMIDSNAENNYSLGYIYSNEFSEFEIAEKYFNESLKYDSLNVDTINAYAWLHHSRKEYSLAEEKFILAVKTDSNQTVYNQIIQFYLSTRQFDKAEEKIRESKELNGVSFTNDGFNIAYKLLTKQDYTRDIYNFKNDYGDFEVEWLRDIVNEISSETIPSIQD